MGASFFWDTNKRFPFRFPCKKNPAQNGSALQKAHPNQAFAALIREIVHSHNKHLGETAGVTQVLVFGSIYQGAILAHFSEPQPPVNVLQGAKERFLSSCTVVLAHAGIHSCSGRCKAHGRGSSGELLRQLGGRSSFWDRLCFWM